MSVVTRLAAMLCGICLMPLGALAEDASVTGTAIYRERIALPPNAVFTALLQDTSLQDVAAVEIGRTVIDPAGHPPYHFKIAYDSAKIDQSHTYTVRASIMVGERLMFTSDTAHRVLTGGAGSHADIMMKMVSKKTPLPRTKAAKPARYNGLFTYMADAAMFQECRTGQRFPVAMEAAFPQLQHAYSNNAVSPGAMTRLSVWATVEPRPKMDGAGTEPTMIVQRLDQISADQDCAEPQPDADLTNTYWRLTDLGEMTVGNVPGNREPYLLLEAGQPRYHATAGCNGLGGEYVLNADARELTFKSGISTMMACEPPVSDYENGLKPALTRTASWSIDGVILTLLDSTAQPVARFRAVYLQ